jgi:dienelactone hydrolase
MSQVLFNRFALVVIAFFGLTLAGCQTAGPPKTTLTASDEGTFAFPGIDNYWRGNTSNLSGTLEFPQGAASNSLPLVVLLHGSAGPGYRSRTWANYFLDNGYATFRLDYYTLRGLTQGGQGGPKAAEDVYSALSVLKTHPRVDTSRIAIMGFSRGGTITARSMNYSADETGGVHPAAFIMLYGGCEGTFFSSDSPDVPILFLVGADDDLVPATACESAMELGQSYDKDVRTVVYPNAYHGFDDNASRTVSFGGSSVRMQPDSDVTAKARVEVLGTLKRAFAKGS